MANCTSRWTNEWRETYICDQPADLMPDGTYKCIKHGKYFDGTYKCIKHGKYFDCLNSVKLNQHVHYITPAGNLQKNFIVRKIDNFDITLESLQNYKHKNKIYKVVSLSLLRKTSH